MMHPVSSRKLRDVVCRSAVAHDTAIFLCCSVFTWNRMREGNGLHVIFMEMVPILHVDPKPGFRWIMASDFAPIVSECGRYMKAVAILNTCDFSAKTYNARALEVMIPCYNNSATCHIRLKHFRDARVLAENVRRDCVEPWDGDR